MEKSIMKMKIVITTWVIMLHIIVGALRITSDSYLSNEVWALIAFKEAIYEDPYVIMAHWNGLDPTPCDWSGVSCSMSRDRVVELNLSGLSLKGFLPPELSLLINLQKLILHGNNLIGSIPKEIGMLKNLKVLDLGHNRLTGPIPHELGNLTSIRKINLQSNGLTGFLPFELSNLKSLQELRLDRNKLQGTFPAGGAMNFPTDLNEMYASTKNSTGFCGSTQLKVADFSYNFFVGSIPNCLHYLPRVSFRGNCLQEKDIKQRTSAQCGKFLNANIHSAPIDTADHKLVENRTKHRRASKAAWLLAVEIVIGIVVGVLVLIALFATFKLCNHKSSLIIPWKKSGSDKNRLGVYIDSDMLKDIMRFNRHELEVACEDFSNIIGSSSDSMAYKGIMKDGSEIAVISFCIKEEQWTGYHELYFQREVADLARLKHENTGKLLGYCREVFPFTRMLVFEYTSNGTLYEHLHSMFEDEDGYSLSWTRRMRIIIGIARGLRYLHSELYPPFAISELNSNGIYLTDDFSPKLVDFGSWKTIFTRSEKNSCAIDSNGPICVLPSSIEGRDLDIKGNIYAFGVLLLEIVSGKPPFCKEIGNLVDWGREYLEEPEAMPDMVDSQLKHYNLEELKAVCEVASLCLNPDLVKRPSMHDLCSMIESRIDLSMSAELRSSSLAWAELALST